MFISRISIKKIYNKRTISNLSTGKNKHLTECITQFYGIGLHFLLHLILGRLGKPLFYN